MVPNCLKEGRFIGFFWLHIQAAMVERHQAHDVGAFGAQEVSKIHELVIVIAESWVLVFLGVGVVVCVCGGGWVDGLERFVEQPAIAVWWQARAA